MREGKSKFLEDAARVIDGRVAVLKAEMERDAENGIEDRLHRACERTAILEAELCAKLIRQLKRAPYRGDPYIVARERRSKHGDPL